MAEDEAARISTRKVSTDLFRNILNLILSLFAQIQILQILMSQAMASKAIDLVDRAMDTISVEKDIAMAVKVI